MATGRRTFLQSLPFAAASAKAKNKVPSVYDELGIKPVINFRGTITTIGASKQWPELHAAMEEASRHFVDLGELQDKIGERLSNLIGTEAATVTTGAAGAITAGTCACIAGNDPKAIHRLPDITGLKNEVVSLRQHRSGYDHAVRNVGAKIIEVADASELKRTINSNTAMMYWLGGTSGDYAWPETSSLEECLKITKAAGVPMMVDAANMLPPWENLRRLAAANVELICISGGKHMRGPQCSGILAGRKDLVAAAKLNISPHSDSLGRGMKVGREEMIGIWVAAEKYSKLDFDAIDKECQRQAEYLRKAISRIPGLKTEFTPFDRTRKVRRVSVQWDESALGITTKQAEKLLWDGFPRIAVLGNGKQGFQFTVFMNEPGDEKLAARRMEEIFSKKS